MTLTDQEKSQIREAASVPSNQRANPDTCRALLLLLDELDSTRQQLTALRDDCNRLAQIGDNRPDIYVTDYDRGYNAARRHHAAKIDQILKGKALDQPGCEA